MAGRLKDPVQFWQELKQRKVVRASTVYIAGAFALLQAIDMIFPRIGLPGWSETLAIIVLAAGLVVVIILTWIFDITPEGIKRTNDREQADDESKPEVEYVVTGWKSSMSQSREELISYNNGLFAEKVQKDKKKTRIYSYSSVVVILAVVVLFTFSSANTVPFEKRDWIVITDFENLTENPVFDKSLYTAFTLTANQSRHINILPRSRMLETLARMKIKDQGYIDDKTGREIAIREGINLYIVPSISEVGNKYVIAAKIMESKSGDLLRSEVIYAETQDEILGKLDQLSKRIRRHLGESRYNIAIQDKPLKQVTTSSLEALKLFSLAIDHHAMQDFEGAKDYYENALKIDTGFTSARASLGNLLIEHFDPAKGRELLSQAVKSVDNLTERERLGILNFYALNVEHDIPKGIEYARMRIELYPDDAAARNNLGYLYQNSGQFEEALKEYKATVKIFPKMLLSYGGIERIYLEKVGKADSALVWSEKMISGNPENGWGYFYQGSAWFCLDSLEKAQQSFLKASEINPLMVLYLYRLAHTYRTQGLHKEAIRILEKILEIDKSEFPAYSYLGISYMALGDQEIAREYLLRFKKIAAEVWIKEYPDLTSTYTLIGEAYARLNEMDSSRLMLQKAIAIDSTQHFDFATVLCSQGNIPEALDQIEKALEKGYRDLTWLKMNPSIQILQNEPRFHALLKHYFNH
jgi:tetratricopeptide (TPR) repeat protein